LGSVTYYGQCSFFFFVPCPLRRGGYEGVHHTPSVIWFRAYSSTNLCMAFVSTEIRTPALVVRSQSSIHWATPQLAMGNVQVFHNWSTFSTAHRLSNMPKSMTLNVRQLQQAYHEIGFYKGHFPGYWRWLRLRCLWRRFFRR